MPPVTDLELAPKVEVLNDLEEFVGDLMERHIRKRDLWFPTDLLSENEQDDDEAYRRALRERVRGFSDPIRVALALNLITEEGLPHFHRLLAAHLGDESHWRRWNNLWTAEEDRHGAVIHDYSRDSAVFDSRSVEQLQYFFIEEGFSPEWDRDPYRVFVYTTLQERATQVSHANTGQLAGEHEPLLAHILGKVASDEARHFAFYREVFREVLKRDPDRALESAAEVMPAIDMPAVDMPGFKEFADVVRRAGIYGPRDYVRIVQEQIEFWRIESITGLRETGKVAQEKILGIPKRLQRIAEYIERKSQPKTFSFDLVWHREFSMA